MTFSAQLAAFGTKVGTRLDAVTNESIVGMGDKLIGRTPIDEGAAKSNYNIGVGAPDLTTNGSTTTRTLNGIENLPAHPAGGRYFISNSLPYIAKLEFGGYPNPPKKGAGKTIGGFSTQAPQGMFAISAIEWPELVYDIARKVAA